MDDVKIFLTNIEAKNYDYLENIILELESKEAKIFAIENANQIFFCKNMINEWIEKDFNYCYIYSRDMFILKFNIK